MNEDVGDDASSDSTTDVDPSHLAAIWKTRTKQSGP